MSKIEIELRPGTELPEIGSLVVFYYGNFPMVGRYFESGFFFGGREAKFYDPSTVDFWFNIPEYDDVIE